MNPQNLIELTYENFLDHVKVGDDILVFSNGEYSHRTVVEFDDSDTNSFIGFGMFEWNHLDEGIICYVERKWENETWADLYQAVSDQNLNEVLRLAHKLVDQSSK